MEPILEAVLSEADPQLDEPVLSDKDIAFSVSIGDIGMGVFHAIAMLQEKGLSLPDDLLLRVREEFSDDEDIMYLLDRGSTPVDIPEGLHPSDP